MFIKIIYTSLFFLILSFILVNIRQDSFDLNQNNNKIIIKKEKIQKVSLAMVGDMLVHSRIYKDAYKEGIYDFKPMLKRMKKKFKDFDLVFYNQETIIGGKRLRLSTYPRFNSPEEVGEAMVWAGANLVSLANNHTLDRGTKAIENSLSFWSGQKDVFIAGSYKNREGKELNKIFEKNGIKFAFFAYTTLTNGLKVKNKFDVDIFNKEKVKEDILSVKDKVDVILVSMHWGSEYLFEPTKEQKEIASFLADLNVDVVIGSHPHVVEPVEKIKDTLVIYSLGNFLSAQIGEKKRVGLMVSLDFEKKKNKIERENIKTELLYTFYNKNSPMNFEVIPFNELDDSLLKNYKEIEKKNLEIVNFKNN